MRCRTPRLRPTNPQRFSDGILGRPPSCRRIVRPSFGEHVVPVLAHRRLFGLSSIPSVLVPPVVFGGLLISLWTYKCMMMVIFQNKIIYMPSVPPFSRAEKVSDYAAQCRPVEWTEHGIKSIDGTKIKLLEGSILSINRDESRKHVLVIYFQGNASSLPPRLPYLSSVLKSLQSRQAVSSNKVYYTCLAVSYRGFWTSAGRPNQSGIELDAQAALEWASERYPNAQIVLWGQSIGAGVATVSLAKLMEQDGTLAINTRRRVTGLLLETPFTSLRAMLVALYPQKFLPYRYLTPFLQSTWDSEAAMRSIAEALHKSERHTPLKIVMLQAENDEIVPAENSDRLVQVIRNCSQGTIEIERKIVRGALHTEVMAKPEGRKQIVEFLQRSGLEG